jgi:hypothetical protein
MAVYRNTDVHTRTWGDLINPTTHVTESGVVRRAGTTLELEPGERAELELPAHFADPYLQPVPDEPQESQAGRSRSKDKEPVPTHQADEANPEEN